MRWNIILNYKWFLAFILLLTLYISVSRYLYIPPAGSVDLKYGYTHFNDYLIFKQSYFHLIKHTDLYVGYPYEYYDLYKYGPTFSILMAPFAYLPNIAGLILWSFINAFILFYAFRIFPFVNEKKKLFALAFIFIEATTALLIFESNCIMAGLMILAFLCMEHKKNFWAAFLIILAAFIKPFALAMIPLFLFYDDKWKSTGYLVLWFLILLLLPLIAVTPHELVYIYQKWGMLLQKDHDASFGLSVMGLLHSWFGIDSKYYTVCIGILLFMLPLLRFKAFANQTFRQLFLAFTLVWVTIFNHKAESPGYILAVSGIAIWFSLSYSRLNLALLILCFVFTSLSPTDFFPVYFRTHFFLPYSVKVIPCIIIWVKMLYELMTTQFSHGELTTKTS